MPVHPTPQDHPNADLVKELFDDDGMVWTVTGDSPAAGVTTWR